MKKINWLKLAAAIALCQVAGLIGSIFTVSSIPTWYQSLVKPAFGPPNWLFGPVWVTLYTLMGISLYIVWQKGIGKKQVKDAVTVFLIQLALNSLWSIIFFGFKNIPLAFIEIIALLFAIALTFKKFYRIDKTAGILLLPYLAWSAFASYLTYSILMLNR